MALDGQVMSLQPPAGGKAGRVLSSVLITGAGGFMGSHLSERLLREGVDVTAVLRRTSTQALDPHVSDLPRARSENETEPPRRASTLT